MTKFKVGDKVIFNKENTHVAKQFDYKINKPYEVQEVFPFHHTVQIINEKGSSHSFDEERFELVETKPTKNQRITALENEVAELKLIVHELRGKKSIESSTTNTVEDIIEFEGQQYRKVDRVACQGDVVIIRKPADDNRFARLNTPHKVVVDERQRLCINNPDDALVYNNILGRTSKTVEVYELIQSKPLTPNQQRAAIIEKAKEFIDKHDKDTHINIHDNAIIAYKLDTADFGISKCNPSDVFNEHIGKAIALGRALGLDVSEFEQAVQPTIAVGQTIDIDYYNDGTKYIREVVKKDSEVTSSTNTLGFLLECSGCYSILNDTNAKYEVES